MKTPENYGYVCRRAGMPGDCHIDERQQVVPVDGVSEMADVCQVAHIGLDKLECSARESGGYRCEVIGPHEQHAVGEHTIEHDRRGNGWLCDFRRHWTFGGVE